MRAILPLLLIAACSAPPPAEPQVLTLHSPAWLADAAAGWDRAAQPAVLHATGRAPAGKDREAASKQAEDAARAQLEPRLAEAVGQLQRVWREAHESQLEPAQLDALAADDAATRKLVLQSLAGARLKGQWVDDEAFWAWLELDTLTTLLPAFEAELTARLTPLARELTPADHAAFTAALTALVGEHGGQ
jgi:hypothetical protein